MLYSFYTGSDHLLYLFRPDQHFKTTTEGRDIRHFCLINMVSAQYCHLSSPKIELNTAN